MATALETVRDYTGHEYKYGFVTEIESDFAPKGLDAEIVRFISAKKHEPEWLTDWRLKALERWQTMEEPGWARVSYPPIDYQAISYYAAPKSDGDRPKSLEEVDPEDLPILGMLVDHTPVAEVAATMRLTNAELNGRIERMLAQLKVPVPPTAAPPP